LAALNKPINDYTIENTFVASEKLLWRYLLGAILLSIELAPFLEDEDEDVVRKKTKLRKLTANKEKNIHEYLQCLGDTCRQCAVGRIGFKHIAQIPVAETTQSSSA